MQLNNDNQQVDAIVDDLSRGFADQIERKPGRGSSNEGVRRYSTARIQQFVPVLTRRIARKELPRHVVEPPTSHGGERHPGEGGSSRPGGKRSPLPAAADGLVVAEFREAGHAHPVGSEDNRALASTLGAVGD
jgi:hypothetical protein